MTGCFTHARNGYISTSALKSDITIVFLDPDFLKDARECSQMDRYDRYTDRVSPGNIIGLAI